MNISIVDGGTMENVLIDQVTMTGVRTPIFIRLGNRAMQYIPTAPVPPVGIVRNVTVSNVTAIAKTNTTSSVTGIVGYYPENILLKNISITIPGGFPPGPSSVPEDDTGYPKAEMFGNLPAWGLYARHVKNIQLENYCVKFNNSDLRQFLVYDDVISSSLPVVGSGGINTSCADLTTGISNLEQQSLFIFPNPTNGEFIINTEDRKSTIVEKIEIYNSLGQLVYIQSVSKEQEKIDLSKHRPGVYWIKLHFREESIPFKLILTD
jgi:hypothetical protein